MSIIILPDGLTTPHLHLIDWHYFAYHPLLLCRGCGSFVSTRRRRGYCHAHRSDAHADSHQYSYPCAITRYINGRAHHLPLAHTAAHVHLATHAHPVQHVHSQPHLHRYRYPNSYGNSYKYIYGNPNANPLGDFNRYTYLHAYHHRNTYRDSNRDTNGNCHP